MRPATEIRGIPTASRSQDDRPPSSRLKSPYQLTAVVFCLIFGIALIANTQTANEGTWYWYAALFRDGQRLYSGMHLSLQPLFVLETAANLNLFGKSWLASKIPAVLHLIAYCFGLMVLANSSDLSDRKKALFSVSAFFVSINFSAYRFDDYHVLADCCEVYSLILLLRMSGSAKPSHRDVLAVMLGVLSALSIMTRLNDGAALFTATAIAVLCLVPAKRIVPLATFCLSTAVTCLLVIRLTGDSLRNWAAYSILKAAGSKGGTGHILTYPFQLPWNALQLAAGRTAIVLLVYVFASLLIGVLLIRPCFHTRNPTAVLKAVAASALIIFPFPYVKHALVDFFPTLVFPLLGVILAYTLTAILVARFVRHQLEPNRPWNPREFLLLIPLGQYASGSMSSGGSPLGLNSPLAILLLLLPVVFPIRLKDRTHAFAFAFLAFLAFLAVDSVACKALIPYKWHSYISAPLFSQRQWYRHPDYGAMILQRTTADFIQPICDAVEPDGAQQGLLSLPYSYPNYFCAIPPWHDYVQTFYDTSSRETIQTLINELQTAPPKWIVYQQQPYNMALHEQIFNHGNPLPHRALDQLMTQKLASGEWHSVYTSPYGSNGRFLNTWTLIRTR